MLCSINCIYSNILRAQICFYEQLYFSYVVFLFVPDVLGEAGIDYRSSICVSLLLPSVIPFRCRLHHPSTPLLSLSPPLPSPPNPVKYLFTQSSHFSLGLPLLLPPFTLSASALFVNRSPFILSTFCSAHFNRLLAGFLLKFYFTPINLLRQLLHASPGYSFHCRNSSHRVIFSQTFS